MAFVEFVKKRWTALALIAIFLGSFLIMFFSSKADSLVVDEKVHISAGYTHVWQGNYLFNAEHPPLLNDLAGFFAKFAKPNLPAKQAWQYSEPVDQWTYGEQFFYLAGNNAGKIIAWARFPFILLTLGLVYLVYIWSRELFGIKAGLVAAALTAFCPNIIAHGRLATTDIGLVTFFVLTLWLLRKYIKEQTWKSTILLGLSLALVILAKYSAVIILPLVLLGLVYVWFTSRRHIAKDIAQLLCMVLIAVALIWGVYAFSMRRDIEHPGPYQLTAYFGSKTLVNPAAKWLVAPFDKYMQGYVIVADHNTVGHWAYLNGSVDYKGWWQYFPEVLALKLPLSVMALFFLALIFFIDYKKSFKEEIFIIVPPLLFFIVAMTSKIDIGIRHILVVLPFMFIYISRLFYHSKMVLKYVALGLVLVSIGLSIAAYPNYISYFNQFAGGPVNASRYLADSNLDWNQSMLKFAKYAKENNIKKVNELCWENQSFIYYGINAQVLPNNPINEPVVICVQQIKVPVPGFDIGWVTKYPPDAIIGGTMYLWRFDQVPVEKRG